MELYLNHPGRIKVELFCGASEEVYRAYSVSSLCNYLLIRLLICAQIYGYNEDPYPRPTANIAPAELLLGRTHHNQWP